MSQQTGSILQAIYNFTFLWYDPIGCVWGLYLNMFHPDHFLRLYVPNAVPDQTHGVLHGYIGGAMISFAVIQGVLLRYTDDVKVWRIINVGMIAWDACILRGCYITLAAQGKLAPGTWGFDDRLAVGLPALVGLVRVLYVAGVGLDSGSGAAKVRPVRRVPSQMDRERTA
jgi:hypothetical protein